MFNNFWEDSYLHAGRDVSHKVFLVKIGVLSIVSELITTIEWCFYLIHIYIYSIIVKIYSPVKLFFFRCFLASVQKHMQKENISNLKNTPKVLTWVKYKIYKLILQHMGQTFWGQVYKICFLSYISLWPKKNLK